MNKIEILAPAGSFESVMPAVRMGADAIYLGADCFSARAGAKNFDNIFLAQAVKYCHNAGVKVHLTLNTLISDRELPKALALVKYACSLPVDAIIVQDLGLATLIKKSCPSLPIHGSTQMSVHTVDGAKLLYNMGFNRIVLSRELSKAEITEIVINCPIETEVFVHGALCMSVSGQCLFSAMLGSRSGNRGQCAQPCRLPFSVAGKADCYDLSLKDMSILNNLQELQKIGVTSAKIEGRMKRPEYVAMAVAAAKESRDNGVVSDKSYKILKDLFSRQGFTDGYYTGKIGKEMFGIRSKESVETATEKLFSEVRAKYKNEIPQVELSFCLKIQKNVPVTLTATDNLGNTATAVGVVPEAPQNTPISKEKCVSQLSKTGGTIFICKNIQCKIENDLTVPVSELNRLRREVLSSITNIRTNSSTFDFDDNIIKYAENIKEVGTFAPSSPSLRLRFLTYDIPKDSKTAELIFLPISSPIFHVKTLLQQGYNIAIEIPRVLFGKEPFIRDALKEFKLLGISHVLVNNLGALQTAKELGFVLHGGFGLNIFNTASILWAQNIGLADVELSLELTAAQINDLGGSLPRGIIGYGYLPLMITKNCPAKNAGKNCDSCKTHSFLTDRKKEKFPLLCDGISTEILNCIPLYIYDQINDFKRISFTTARFSVENYVEIEKKLRIIHLFKDELGRKTRGLYYRGVK